MTTYELRRIQIVPRPVEAVFPFFADAGNLDALTPPWLHFSILTQLPVEMRAGLLLDYRIRWHGVPVRWRTEIEQWEPNRMFVDHQIRGPYALWHHTHTFDRVDGGTRMTDVVRYALPMGPIGTAMHRLIVRRDVERIFDYRREQIARRFGVPAERRAVVTA